MPDITISESRVKVIEANRQVLEILRQLQSDTGLRINGVDLEISHNICGNFVAVVSIKTEL